jgi:crotonobetaine/carnitine-CoA ligase
LVEQLKLNESDVLYCPFPLFHADATALTTVPALLLGATAAIAKRFSVSKFWVDIRESGATVFDFMGATLSMLNKVPPRPDDGENPVRVAWGVPVPDWVEEFERRFELKVVELYGSVEASIPVVEDIESPRVPRSCGRVVSGFRVAIQDEHGSRVAVDTVGEIVVRPEEPAVMFDGYFGMPEETLLAFRDLWFHTGDLGRIDAGGNLYFLGRKKDSIRRRGENISSFEVEEGILLHPDVIECAVVAIASDLGEDEILAYVVLRKGSDLSFEELESHCENVLAKFQVPQFFEILEEIPKTQTGKYAKHLIVGNPERRWERSPRVKSGPGS